ncbi:MAG: hypothetical protein K2K55_08015 [Duncaniella sp.]|nr:hypothetical protein [Duncaniella sp.]
MARTKKSAEMETVISNLKSATFAELQQVKELCEKLMNAKKQEEIEATEKQIKELQSKLAELKK